MIRDGTVPTLTVEELREILAECFLVVEKTRNTRQNLGRRGDLVLCERINQLILRKAETDY